MDEIKSTFKWLEEHKGLMSLSQLHFIDSLKKFFKRNGYLSDKQCYILFEIRRNIQPPGQLSIV